MKGKVIGVHSSPTHSFSKYRCDSIELVAGKGVIGDAHFGKTVQHLSRVKKDPSQPNLRQIHLLETELLSELKEKGFDVRPGNLGENITTAGIPLLQLPEGTQLTIGDDVTITLTGLRNPCPQIENFMPGLLSAVLYKNKHGETVRRCGVMGIIDRGGCVESLDSIVIELPPEPHLPLKRV